LNFSTGCSGGDNYDSDSNDGQGGGGDSDSDSDSNWDTNPQETENITGN